MLKRAKTMKAKSGSEWVTGHIGYLDEMGCIGRIDILLF
jgi:hypothetical protein